jgi:hypothetical protein
MPKLLDKLGTIERPVEDTFWIFNNWWKELNAKVTEFESVQQRYQNFGAWDSVVDDLFAMLLSQALKAVSQDEPLDDGLKAPTDAESWLLYTSSMDCTKAGLALGRACQRVLDHLDVYFNGRLIFRNEREPTAV